jgi:hypothetical protein
MYEPLPRMTQHLISRYNLVGHMAGALYDAIGESGLRLPARRDLARAPGCRRRPSRGGYGRCAARNA